MPRASRMARRLAVIRWQKRARSSQPIAVDHAARRSSSISGNQTRWASPAAMPPQPQSSQRRLSSHSSAEAMVVEALGLIV